MTLNGALVHLAEHGYTATIAAAGATLVSLEHRARPLVVPFDPEAGIGRGFQGRTLVPWPNRIAGGAYRHGGDLLEVAVNEPGTGSALHGLGSFVPWVVEGHTPAAVELSLDLPASPGYPFDVVCHASYRLTASGLVVEITGRNEGRTPAPFGSSSHPYLTCFGAPLDECAVSSPAGQLLLVDERMRPTGLAPVDGTPWDFRDTTQLAGRSVDHAFTALPAGGWAVTLSDATGAGVVCTSEAPWVQLYSGEALERAGLAVEPMTCPPNAFNDPDADVLLAPGAISTLTFTIGVLES